MKITNLILLIIGFAMAIAYPHVFTLPFPQHLMIMVFIYATLGLGWNLIGGYAGQISLGHAVYFGVGAYTSTLLLMKAGVNPWIGLVMGAAIASIISLIIGYPCFRLGGHYFAIATIAAGEITQQAWLNWDWAGSAIGLNLPILEEGLINLQFHSSKMPYYYLALIMASLALLITYLVDRSKLGYYFKAIKGDQNAARSLGISHTKYKAYAMVMSSSIAAIAGSFYAQYVLFIDPDSVFPLLLSINMCLFATLGGLGTVWGPAIGAFILIPISEFTRIKMGGGGTGFDLMVYGFLIVVICLYQPNGVIGIFKQLQKKRGKT
ncbi:MAG: branched-chain amino acid ABC transporter permease [Deltaproteobacteria bacterium]|nr:branched-chain amino acid ABC transporter permease [Deltaproteobacteria bacterium]